MKMQNMGNPFIYFRHSSVPGVNSFKMVGVNCSLIPDRPSEPTRGHLGSLVSPIIANIFMQDLETKAVQYSEFILKVW